jgi:hypothetical protein
LLIRIKRGVYNNSNYFSVKQPQFYTVVHNGDDGDGDNEIKFQNLIIIF